MALRPRDIPITRDEVIEWLDEHKGLGKNKPPIRDFLDRKVHDKKLPETTVDTTGHEDRGDETELVDLILDDLASYGYE